MATFFLSYADEGGFRGALIIAGSDFLQACVEARRLGISPGGQVRGVELDPGVAALVPFEYRNRLLSEAEVVLLEPEMEKRIELAVN